jgi:transcriptional regulator with XRE-family HTH domain
MRPETYTSGLGEQIAAHRAYIGISQRGMARRLGVDRRFYQRVENGQDDCPPGFLDSVIKLVDAFDTAVDSVLDYAAKHGNEVNVEIQRAARWEWERNVAYRAAVIGPSQDSPVRVDLTLVGEVEKEAS